MKIQDLPKHVRPREKLIIKGVENLKNKELLAILFRTGNKKQNAIELAEYVLSKYPMQVLSQKNVNELTAIAGIDTGKACSLVAAFELTKRALNLQDTSLPFIQSPQDVLQHVIEMRKQKKEHFVALFLNARNQLLLKEVISVGTLTASLVHPREVFEPALRISAASIIVVHNHPSGETEPSEEDKEITQRLIKAGKLLGIDVIDHIIVTATRYISMKELHSIE